MTPHWYARAERCSACDLRRLFSRCSAGDARARETIILRFLPLARRVAWIYVGRGVPLEDLCQVASVGLIKAVDRYSPERGVAFSAYARPVIHGEIRRYFRDNTWFVHVPRPVRERAGHVLRAARDLGTMSTPARPEAIAGYLGISRDEVVDARSAVEAHSPRSLDVSYAAPDGHARPLGEVIGAEESNFGRVELSIGICQVLRSLKPRDQEVLLLRLVWELSQDEIASRVDLSQMQVSRILRKAGTRLIASCGLAMSPPRKRDAGLHLC